MSTFDDAYWLRVERLARSLQPEIASAILAAFRMLRESLSVEEIAALIASGRVDALLSAQLDEQQFAQTFAQLRFELQAATASAFRRSARDIRNAANVLFDILNPRTIDAIRALDTRVMRRLQEETRETVRAFVENGIRDGLNPRDMARDLRTVIGMAPHQEEYVQNLRRELEEGRYADARQRLLLDRRFRLERLDALSPADRAARIDRIVGQYRKSFVALNTETNARTATLDTLKLGQRLSWESAIEQGVVARDQVKKRWVSTGDSRVRPEHEAMNEETVPFDATFSNGEMVPGESTYNCRCLARYFAGR